MKGPVNTIKTNKPSGGFFQNKRLQLILISIFVFVLYARTLKYEYIGLDDTTLIETNYGYIKNFSNIPKAFKTDVMYFEKSGPTERDYYRPMLTLSFMLDAHIAGNTKPGWYHFSNLLYHIIACLLLFTLLYKLGVNRPATFFLTLLFAVHPVVDQAVAWIPGRNDVLLAIFLLSSFIFFIDYLTTKNNKDLLWHILFFACTLFTKENGIMLPFICIFYFLFIQKDKLNNTSKTYLISGYLVFIITWFLLRSVALQGSTTDNSFGTILSNFTHNLPFIFQYIGKAILPFNLSVMCVQEDANYIQEITALVLIAAAIYFSKNKRRAFIFFGLIWFIIFLVPSFSARLVEGLEHRLYVPIIGFIILAAETDWMKNLSTDNKKSWIVPLAYILILLYITNSRLDIFKTRFNFNLSAMQTSAYTVVPCVNLAGDYDIAGRKEDAISMYKIALKRDSVYGIIHPNNRVSYYSILHDNLGVIYLDKKMFTEAEKEFILGSKSGDAYAIYHLANVYLKTQRLDRAAVLWKKVLTLQPDQPDFKNTYLYLAQYSKDKGDSASFTFYIKEFKRRGY
jgi:tetratricopeptide (TPR) repeat protein